MLITGGVKELLIILCCTVKIRGVRPPSMVQNDTSTSPSAGDLNGSFDNLTNREMLKLIMKEIRILMLGEN